MPGVKDQLCSQRQRSLTLAVKPKQIRATVVYFMVAVLLWLKVGCFAVTELQKNRKATVTREQNATTNQLQKKLFSYKLRNHPSNCRITEIQPSYSGTYSNQEITIYWPLEYRRLAYEISLRTCIKMVSHRMDWPCVKCRWWVHQPRPIIQNP